MNQIEGKKSRMDLSEPAAYADAKNYPAEQYGFTIVLDPKDAPSNVSSIELFTGAKIFRASALPIHSARQAQVKKIKPAREVPKKIRDMRSLYDYSHFSFQQKSKNFYQQALFMADYEDDEPWDGEYVRYFPTYQELPLRQLRGYFSWRTRVRKGEFHPIAASLAYMYLYELLNRIGPGGIISAEESLEKMREFEKGWLDSGFGGATMRENLRRWMLEFAVVQNVPPETARKYAAKICEADNALLALKTPDKQSDEAVVRALCVFAEKRTAASPVFESAKGKHLFAELWRRAFRQYAKDGKDLFAACFGSEKAFFWHPLANAVYFERTELADRDYVFDECRSFHLQNGRWKEHRYEKLFFDKTLFGALMHEADRKLRRYLKTGRNLREKAEEAWAAPYIDAVIDADKKAESEARRPKIAIDFSRLDKIRADALVTTESLLTEVELAEANEAQCGGAENVNSADVNLRDYEARDNREESATRNDHARSANSANVNLRNCETHDNREENATRNSHAESANSANVNLRDYEVRDSRKAGVPHGGRVENATRDDHAKNANSAGVNLRDYEARENREESATRGIREGNEIARTSRAMTGTQSADKTAAFSLAKNAANEFGLRQTRDDNAKNANSANVNLRDYEAQCDGAKTVTALFANPLYAEILAALLAGESSDEIVKGNRLMPEIVADEINETLFDEIGDNAVVCEGDKLSIIEDYKTDAAKLLEAGK